MSFSQQAGLQVIFSSKMAGGVKTRAVSGEMTARQALDAMLEGTGLAVIQDPDTGAFTITRPVRPTREKSEAPQGESTSSAGGVSGAPRVGDSRATGSIRGRVINVITGQYLGNARVHLRGTDNTVFTNRDGTYILVNVPAGPATLEVFYTDLDLATPTVEVPAGGTAEADVELSSVARYGTERDTVKLDAFVVTQDRETDAQALATNEQRFAANIKNVFASDSLGEVIGNVGEFIKFIPGITVENDLADISGIAVRGIGSNMTSITNDGAPSSNIWVSATRTVDVRSMALNDVSRIEVSKVPTPANPSDALAGSINLVSKSAFERKGTQIRYSLGLLGNSENLTLGKTPHSHKDAMTRKVFPAATIDFTWPITKRFGIVIAGNSSRSFNEQHRTLQTWSSITRVAGQPIDYANPLLSGFQLLDGPRDLTRNTLSLKADWKVTEHSVLSLSHLMSRTDTRIGSMYGFWGTGTNLTSSVAGGTVLSWDGNQTIGSTGRATVQNYGTNQLINQVTDTSTLTFRYDDGRWRVEAGGSRSASETKRRYFDQGFFTQFTSNLRNPSRVSFIGIGDGRDRPDEVLIFNNSNQPVDYFDLANFRAAATGAATNLSLFNHGSTNQAYANVRRTLDFMPVPTALQGGASVRWYLLDTNISSEAYNYMGPGGTGAATASVVPYASQNYRGLDNGYGFHGIDFMSPSAAYAAWQADPKLFTQTDAQMASARNYNIDNNENFKEEVQAAYIQFDTRLLHNRLRALGGVRFEKTIDDGIGGLTDNDAVWQRNADGSYVRNAAGARVRKPEAGAAGSLAESLLIKQYRASFSHRTYDGYYPSLHFTYEAVPNFLVRLAYAKTYGRPDLANLIPRTVATRNDFDDGDEIPNGSYRGTLTIRNPALKPWTADNYDLSAEYYTRSGGQFSAGFFVKQLADFFASSSVVATPELLAELGLSPGYEGYNVTTTFNSGDARITGGEINLRHDLRVFGKWGRTLTLFANGTKLDLSGEPGANFSSFVPKSANWGFTFAYKRGTITARWNYRGLNQRGPQAAYGPNGYEYIAARTVLDLNGSFQLTKRFSLVASASNVFNKPQVFLRYGDQTPVYARQYGTQNFGAQLLFGIRGTF